MLSPHVVVHTSHFPAEWKVEDSRWPGSDNATYNFFRFKRAAEVEAAARNVRHRVEERRKELALKKGRILA